MGIYAVSSFMCKSQADLFDFTKKNPNCVGRLGCIPVAAIDIALHVTIALVATVENVANGVLYLLGAAFYKSCTVKKSVKCLESSFVCIGIAAARTVTSPVSLLYQIGSLLLQPESTNSIQFGN